MPSSNNNWLSYKGDSLTAPNQVKGFNSLSEENQKLFTIFLQNFYRVWEFPEEKMPVKVTFKRDKNSGNYLRVDFKDMWLHVSPDGNSWY